MDEREQREEHLVESPPRILNIMSAENFLLIEVPGHMCSSTLYPFDRDSGAKCDWPAPDLLLL